MASHPRPFCDGAVAVEKVGLEELDPEGLFFVRPNSFRARPGGGSIHCWYYFVPRWVRFPILYMYICNMYILGVSATAMAGETV